MATLASAAWAEAPADVEVFVRPGCPHCEEAEAFLDALARERPALRVLIRDVVQDRRALARLQAPAAEHHEPPRFPRFWCGDTGSSAIPVNPAMGSGSLHCGVVPGRPVAAQPKQTYGRGVSLSLPASAKPGFYACMRKTSGTPLSAPSCSPSWFSGSNSFAPPGSRPRTPGS
ncbi:glutaredoxin domain-containing protein [Methylococcus sp. Mc7]|uniref:glutaredoxin family protein n=1 Tax=Methylococcus sp. Mc7 TaxID=2860258 RepID=UPI0021084B4D|nr:glutaredoxin domain-containing protein [Methylococcus sp. Mc7]